MIKVTEKILRSAISAIGFPLTIFQSFLSKRALYQYKTQGVIINVGNHNLHAVVTGEGEHQPTVILESGMGGCALDWALVQPSLSRYTKVLSYDRAGFGWSTQTINKPTCENYVTDLHNLLSMLDLKPPYLLVGHSYGGMIMRLFASKYPADVMGIILVDSTHEKRFSGPDFSKFRRMEQKKHRNLLRLGYLLSPIAVPRLIKRHIGAKRLPFNIQQIVNALGYRNNAYKAAYLEFLSILESAEQLHKSQPLKSEMPIIVLSAGRQSKEWIETQKELLKLTMNTKHFVVGESWHSIHIHHPQAVIDSVICLLSDGKS